MIFRAKSSRKTFSIVSIIRIKWMWFDVFWHKIYRSIWLPVLDDFHSFAWILLRGFTASRGSCFAVSQLRVDPASRFHSFAWTLLRGFTASRGSCYAVSQLRVDPATRIRNWLITNNTFSSRIFISSLRKL